MKKAVLLSGNLLLLLLFSACTAVPAPGLDATGTPTSTASQSFTATAAMQTQTPAPSATPTLIQTETPSPTPTIHFITVPTLENVPTLAVYASPGMRVLEHPVAVVRDEITLAIEQVAVYSDRTELIYTVRDIPQSALFDPFTDDPSLSCGGPPSYANLRLPDGTIIYPENYLLDGKAFDMFKPFAWVYTIHIYRSPIPENISDLSMVLECIGMNRLDRGLQNWEVPFRIVPGG